MKFLLTSDIHISPRSQEEYRWEIFSWLRKYAKQFKVDAVFILGDLTDSKDNHPSELVNRMVDEVTLLGDVCPVILLRGNHDCIDANKPFFQFVSVTGKVRFITHPTRIELKGSLFALVPHQREKTPAEVLLESEWPAKKSDFIFMHQTFRNAVSESGRRLEGCQIHKFETDFKKSVCVSGDVHVPQQLGPITYCGAPHPIHFGDAFEPRVLYWNGIKMESLVRVTLKKVIARIKRVDQLDKFGLSENDMLRVVLRIPREEFTMYPKYLEQIRAWCETNRVLFLGCELDEQKRERVGVDAKFSARTVDRESTLKSFAQSRELSDAMLRTGQNLLR